MKKEELVNTAAQAARLYLEKKVANPTQAVIVVLKQMPDMPVPAIERVVELTNSTIYRELYLSRQKSKAFKFPLANKEEVIKELKGKIATQINWSVPGLEQEEESKFRKAASAVPAVSLDYQLAPEDNSWKNIAVDRLLDKMAEVKGGIDTLPQTVTSKADHALAKIFELESKVASAYQSTKNQIDQLIDEIENLCWREYNKGIPPTNIFTVDADNPGIVKFASRLLKGLALTKEDLVPLDGEVNQDHPLVQKCAEFKQKTKDLKKLSRVLQEILHLKEGFERIR